MAATRPLHLPPLPTLREIIRIYKLGSIKHLSQNFLLDTNITEKIVKAVSRNLVGAHVCEVGPGPGGITRSLLNAGVEHLSVIELDKRFIPSLQLLNKASGGKMSIYHGDVLRFDLENLFPGHLVRRWEEGPPNIHLVGNLPFGVSTPLIIKWLHAMAERTQAWRYGRTRLTLTFQKEVAERMVANINEEQRSRLSIMTQYLCDVRVKFNINGSAFVPPPKVDASVVHFTPRVEPLIQHPFKVVEKVVRHVFHYRQKMCKRGIQTLFPPDMPELTKEMLTQAEVEPDTRPFQLSMEEFERLCTAYVNICKRHPGIIDYYYRSEENSIYWRQERPRLDF